MAWLPWLMQLGAESDRRRGRPWAALIETPPAGTPDLRWQRAARRGRSPDPALLFKATAEKSEPRGRRRRRDAGAAPPGCGHEGRNSSHATHAVIASNTPDQLYGADCCATRRDPRSRHGHKRAAIAYRRGMLSDHLALSAGRPRFADSRSDGGGGIKGAGA